MDQQTLYQQYLLQYRLAIAQGVSKVLESWEDNPAPRSDAKVDTLYRELAGLPQRPPEAPPYVNLFPGITASTTVAAVSKVVFRMSLRLTDHLLEGQVTLLDGQGKPVLSAIATSGAVGYQTSGEFWSPGAGPLPPLKGLQVSTQAYWCPELKGVNGYWFDILPWTLQGPGGATRAAFGIHFDSNVPGSSGCIVLRDAATFEEKFVPYLKEANRQGIPALPLEVIYT